MTVFFKLSTIYHSLQRKIALVAIQTLWLGVHHFQVCGCQTWPSPSCSYRRSRRRSEASLAPCRTPWTNWWTCSSLWWSSWPPTPTSSDSWSSSPMSSFAWPGCSMPCIVGKSVDISFISRKWLNVWITIRQLNSSQTRRLLMLFDGFEAFRQNHQGSLN